MGRRGQCRPKVRGESFIIMKWDRGNSGGGVMVGGTHGDLARAGGAGTRAAGVGEVNASLLLVRRVGVVGRGLGQRSVPGTGWCGIIAQTLRMIGRFPAPVSSPEGFDRARASRRTPRSDALD
jgi:hypothetical protein